ncbi:MAG: peroxide stress protein YaaA [Aquificaceae bacterium]|nr:peroxide stress protein YaaA [Aquificaceae bacterium]
MFLFILPYSKKQCPVSFRVCNSERFNLAEFEPFARLLEKSFSEDGSLAPLYRRFSGPFWDSLELWVMPPKVMEYVRENSFVLSPLYGLVKPTACIPYAPIGWQELYQGKTLFDFWKEHIKKLSSKLFKDKVLVPLVPKEHLSFFDLKVVEKVVSFQYYKKGKRVKNPAKHYAYTLRYIAEKGLSPSELFKINFYDYGVESVEDRGRRVFVNLRSEGGYEI